LAFLVLSIVTYLKVRKASALRLPSVISAICAAISLGNFLNAIFQLAKVQCHKDLFIFTESVTSILSEPVRYLLYIFTAMWFYNISSGDIKKMGKFLQGRTNYILVALGVVVLVAWLVSLLWFWLVAQDAPTTPLEIGNYYQSIFLIRFSFGIAIGCLEFLMGLLYISFGVVLIRTLSDSSSIAKSDIDWKSAARRRLAIQLLFCSTAIMFRVVSYFVHTIIMEYYNFVLLRDDVDDDEMPMCEYWTFFTYWLPSMVVLATFLVNVILAVRTKSPTRAQASSTTTTSGTSSASSSSDSSSSSQSSIEMDSVSN